MTTHPHPKPHLRTLTATILTFALNTALTTDDRFATAYREAQHATPSRNLLPGHLELLHRECTYRLVHAAQLAPADSSRPTPTTGWRPATEPGLASSVTPHSSPPSRTSPPKPTPLSSTPSDAPAS